MDADLLVKFDNMNGLTFVQGEDRSIVVTLQNKNDYKPIDLTDAVVAINLPLSGGGSIKRTTLGPKILFSQVVVPSGSVPKGYISLIDHGLVTGDPVTLVIVSGGLPSPLAVLTDYLIQTIDKNNFYIADTNGNVISLISQGSGSFNIVNDDLSIDSPAILGQFTFDLRALVSSSTKDGLAQDLQVQYIKDGKTRIEVLSNLLDVYIQPNP
jgi:hypothetical protein